MGVEGVQYRRVERYLSELHIPIQMHPGADPREKTLSFHRPLQSYAKALASAGFAIARIEEWNSHKKSQPGPHAKAEDLARKEIPLFLLLEAKKIRYREDEPNETRRKNSAIRRVQIATERAYKIKTGQLKEEERRGGQHRN